MQKRMPPPRIELGTFALFASIPGEFVSGWIVKIFVERKTNKCDALPLRHRGVLVRRALI